jgi:nucleoside-diphosphate-sugar epimerase
MTELLGDVTKISSKINWKPRYNLIQRLEETIAWWKQN